MEQKAKHPLASPFLREEGDLKENGAGGLGLISIFLDGVKSQAEG